MKIIALTDEQYDCLLRVVSTYLATQQLALGLDGIKPAVDRDPVGLILLEEVEAEIASASEC